MAPPPEYWVVNFIGSDYVIIQASSRAAVEAKYKGKFAFISGPFPTRAAAQEFVKTGNESGKSKTAASGPTFTNPLAGLSGIGKVAHWLGLAVEHTTDTAMWRSLGWMALGIMLFATGIYLWFRTSATYESLQSAVTGTVKAL